MICTHIDFSQVKGRAALHRAVADALRFPDWYGANLDALWDLLSTLGEPVALTLTGCAALDDYGVRALAVFLEAARENPRLRLTVEA